MKKILSLFSCLLLIGCGEKPSSEGSESASEKPTPSNESAEPSADTAKQSPAEPPAAESPSEEPSSATPNSLSDADVERLVKEAIDGKTLEERNVLMYQVNESKPYSGWAKIMYDSGQVKRLDQFKDGKIHGLHTLWHENGQKSIEATFKDGIPDGPQTSWYENGQKQFETTFKDGKEDGPQTYWYENGQKELEAIYKDGEEVSAKYWNSKGEEVETEGETFR